MRRSLRLVAAHGVYAVRFAPDPALQPLDANQKADRRDLARDYRGGILADWKADPTPGRALERACRPVGLNPAAVTELAVREHQAQLERAATAERLQLPAGDPDPDEPMVEFDPQQLLADMRAEREHADAERKERLLTQRREESEARRAALAELAAHTQRREATA
jgi:hypothetical protein